jgi:hypothetical protein
MGTDFLERLAEQEIPPLPESFEQRVHERVNYSLVMLHVLDLAVRGMPWAMLQFGRAVVGLVMMSLSGRFEPPPRERDSDAS